MTPDWKDSTLIHTMRVELLDPMDLTSSRGTLMGVDDSGSLDLNFYSDTRVSLTLKTYVKVGETDGWDGFAAMRLVHVVGDWSEPLFTGFVTSHSWSEDSGILETDYTLSSCMYALSVDLSGWPYTVGAGAYARTAMRSILDSCSRQYAQDPDSTDHWYGTNTVYDAGKSWLSILFDLADTAGDRLDVDGNGVVHIGRYYLPGARTPTYELRTDDVRSVVLSGLSWSDDAQEVPSRVFVHAKDGDMELTGLAWNSSPYTHGDRGYSLDTWDDESQLEPFTQANVDAKARTILAANAATTTKLELSTMYMPLATGDVISLDGTRYSISSASLDLATWVWKLDVKSI